MDISIIPETLNQTSGCYFVVGLIGGYFLKNIFTYKVAKRPRRYRNSGERNEKQNHTNIPSHEPYFNWADAAVKTLTSSQRQNTLNQHSKEI